MRPNRRRLLERCLRLADGDTRSDSERVLDLTESLCDAIDSVPEASSRLSFYGESLMFLTVMAKADFARTTGQTPPFGGSQ